MGVGFGTGVGVRVLYVEINVHVFIATLSKNVSERLAISWTQKKLATLKTCMHFLT